LRTPAEKFIIFYDIAFFLQISQGRLLLKHIEQIIFDTVQKSKNLSKEERIDFFQIHQAKIFNRNCNQ